MKSVAIIGGGITGLTAAFELQKAGVPFTLYESADRVGGPIQSVREGEYLAECGPNTILETSPVIMRMIRELGMEERRIYSNPAASNRYIARNGKPVNLPGSPLEFLRTELFSAKAKCRLAAELFIRRAEPEVEESVAEFVVRRLGAEFLDYAINPMVGGVYAGDPALLSVKHAFPKLHALEQKYGSLIRGQVFGARERKKRGAVSKQNAPKFSFEGGLEVLTRTLASRMRDSICLRHRVRAIVRNQTLNSDVIAITEDSSGRPLQAVGWKVVCDVDGREVVDEHDAVIFAIPAHNLARIAIEGAGRVDLKELDEVYYPPVASVVLGFRREDVEDPLDGFGVLVPEAEGMNILGTIFSSSLFPKRAPEGEVLLTSYLGGARAPELALSSEEALVTNTIEDLKKLLGVRGKPTYIHTFVFRRAIPQYNVGYGRFKKLMGELEAAAPGFLVGGHCRDGISLGDSIVSGCGLAERAGKYLAGLQSEVSPGREYAHA